MNLHKAETFLDQFFGPGNGYWPGREPNSASGRRLREYLDLFSADSDVPYILPRFDPLTQDRLIYVIPRDGTQAATVREYVNAFVVPSYARFSKRAVRDDDRVDAAVVDFVGHRNIVLVQVPLDGAERLWTALSRLKDTVLKRPRSTALAPVPLGRMLADFDLALAAGDNATSVAILDRLAGNGLSGSNYTHLVIKRLAQLGKHGELLRLPDLKSVAASRPPIPVRDAILTAIFSTVVAPTLDSSTHEHAQQALLDRGDLVPPLAAGALEGLSSEALAVLAVAAAGLSDRGLARRLMEVSGAHDQVVSLLPAEMRDATDAAGTGAESAHSTVAGSGDRAGPGEGAERQDSSAAVGVEPVMPVEAAGGQPNTWRDLIAFVATGADLRTVVVDEPWRLWPPPADSDVEIAEALDDLDDASAERAWSLAGAFVDSDEYRTPAARSAQAFITRGLLLGRYGPADLAGLVALTEIVLRSAPSAYHYTQLVNDLNEDVGRWASIERTSVVLDLADLLARNAAPNVEARLRLAGGLLEPLSRQSGRLLVDELKLAGVIDNELSLGLAWDQLDTAADEPALNVAGNMLLYSLDEAVLSRVKRELESLAPGVNVRTNHDYVGSVQLRDRSRHADFIVMATRCAKHAATGFIRSNANDQSVIVEADGVGAASLLRAAINSLKLGSASS